MQSNKTCPLVEQYLSYLYTIKGRSICTIKEYCTDLLSFFSWVRRSRSSPINSDFSFADIEFIKSVRLSEMYGFLTYCQSELNSSPGTRARKIVSIRQFWKYLKKTHLISDNIAEKLESPRQPKRIPKYLSLEESVRLLIAAQNAPRDHCILTLLLNCALRVSELAAINLDQVTHDVISVIGKGNKERKVFLTSAAKNSITGWLAIRTQMQVDSPAFFISQKNCRMTVRAIQDVVKKYVLLAGLDPTAISAHTLRHTSATLMYKYGRVDIRSLQKILGHESVATTEIYTHVDESQIQAAVNSNPLVVMFS